MFKSTLADIQGDHQRVYERHAQVGSRDECWLWTGPIDRHGYASSRDRARQRTSGHRVGYILFRGPIPDGLVLDHLCRNRGCVNPWHLEPVTNRENLLRQRLSGVCRSGLHEMTEDNTYVRPAGTHMCRACHRVAKKRFRDKRKLAKALAQGG